MIARLTFATPEARASVIGGETESENTLQVDCDAKKARLFFRKVTAFVPGTPSTAYAVSSGQIEIDLTDAYLANLLTQFITAAKAQGKVPNDATLTIV